MSKHLREYETPVVRLLEEIPVLVNGKTDRQRLLKMFAAELQNREEFDDWNSLGIPGEKLSIAKTLFKVISTVTGTSIQTIAESLDDSFFNIGGSSLNAVVVIVKLREKGYYISIPDFTSAQTIRNVLMKLEESQGVGQKGNLVENNEKNQEYSITLLSEQDREEVVQ